MNPNAMKIKITDEDLKTILTMLRAQWETNVKTEKRMKVLTRFHGINYDKHKNITGSFLSLTQICEMTQQPESEIVRVFEEWGAYSKKPVGLVPGRINHVTPLAVQEGWGQSAHTVRTNKWSYDFCLTVAKEENWDLEPPIEFLRKQTEKRALERLGTKNIDGSVVNENLVLVAYRLRHDDPDVQLRILKKIIHHPDVFPRIQILTETQADKYALFEMISNMQREQDLQKKIIPAQDVLTQSLPTKRF